MEKNQHNAPQAIQSEEMSTQTSLLLCGVCCMIPAAAPIPAMFGLPIMAMGALMILLGAAMALVSCCKVLASCSKAVIDKRSKANGIEDSSAFIPSKVACYTTKTGAWVRTSNSVQKTSQFNNDSKNNKPKKP